MTKRHNSIIVLESLLDGNGFKFNGDKYVMSEDYDLCVEGTRIVKDGENEPILLNTDMPLKSFIKICESMKDDEVFLIGANNVLRHHNMTRSRVR